MSIRLRQEIFRECKEYGYPTPTSQQLSTVERLIGKLRNYLGTYEVVPSSDQEIDLDIMSLSSQSSVIVSLLANNMAAVYVHVNGEARSNQYQSADELPDIFLYEALEELRDNRPRC